MNQVLAALRITDELLRSTGDGLLAFDMECRYIFWNEAMVRISGLTPDEVLGRYAFDLFPFLRESGEDRCFQETLGGRSVASRDRPYVIPATGRRGSYDAFYSPLRRRDSTITGGAAVIRDITERKRAEQKIRETEGRFQLMADAAPVLLWMSDTDGLCTFFNQSWLEFTGCDMEHEWGVGWAEHVHFEDFQRCIDRYVASFNRRESFEMEYRLQRKDGEFRWILDRGVPRYTPDGTFAGFIGSCIDITEHKTMEGDLRKAVRDRDEFLSIASHELRTPLTTMKLHIDSLMRTLAKQPQEALSSGRLEKNARTASVQTQRLATLIDELLDVSRIASGRLVLDRQSVDLAALARETAQRFGPMLAAAGCRLDLCGKWETGGVTGPWDPLRIDQVITNLLTNAIKYGAGKPIELCVEGTTQFGRLQVRDQGIGISADDQKRIFERFERAVSAQHYGGFGLGLWITRQIVEAHGGSVSVVSQVGSGATFIVELPRDRRDSRAPGPTVVPIPTQA